MVYEAEYILKNKSRNVGKLSVERPTNWTMDMLVPQSFATKYLRRQKFRSRHHGAYTQKYI